MGISGKIHLRHFSSWGGIDIIDGQGVSGEMGRHLHDRDCLGIVESGVRMFNVAGRSIEKRAGTVWYIPAGAVHSLDLSDGPHSYKVINFNLSHLQRYFGLAEQPISLSMDGLKNEPECYRVVRMFCLLADESLPLEAESYLLAVLRHIALGENIERPAAVFEDEKIRVVRRYLDEHFTQPIFIRSLAEMAGWSPFHLERNFLKVVNLPLHQYQKMARIRAAKRMLREGRNLSYIASETGFADQSHFSRAFKELVGITPGAYLKAYRDGGQTGIE